MGRRRTVEKDKTPWYAQKDNDVHGVAFSTLETMEKEQNQWVRWQSLYAALYGQDYLAWSTVVGQHAFYGGEGGADATTGGQYQISKPRVQYNVTRSVIDTIISMISTNRPRPLFLTQDGDWLSQQNGKKLGDFITSIFVKEDLYDLMPLVARDSCVFGSGFLMIHRDGAQIQFERVLSPEVWIDPLSSSSQKPGQMFRRRYLAADTVADWYPDFEAEIRDCPRAEIRTTQNMTVKLVELVDCWQLAYIVDGEVEREGRRSVCIKNATLEDEDYELDHFPIEKLDYSPELKGYRGKGVAENGRGIQFEINSILHRIQQSLHLAAVPRVFLEAGSKVVKSHINNDVGTVVSYVGKPPVFNTPVAVNEETYRYIDTLVDRYYKQEGINELRASGQTPTKEPLSGVALETLNDTESGRFTQFNQAYENFYMRIAERVYDLAAEICEENGSFPINLQTNKALSKTDFAEIKLDRESFAIVCYPVNLLPSTPSGKLEKVQEMIAAGLLTQAQGMRMLDFPDIESVSSEIFSTNEYVHKILDLAITKQQPPPAPDGTLDLKQALTIALQFLKRAEVEGVPEERLTVIRQWIEQLNALQTPEAPPGAPGQAGATSPLPQGAPAAGLPSPALAGGPAMGGTPLPNVNPVSPAPALPGSPTLAKAV